MRPYAEGSWQPPRKQGFENLLGSFLGLLGVLVLGVQLACQIDDGIIPAHSLDDKGKGKVSCIQVGRTLWKVC